jgi:2,3-dihydroxybenzoate-AMP ligase
MLKGCTPLPEEFVKLYHERGYWEDITLWEMLEASIAEHPSKAALVFNKERITYRELGERSKRLASRFAACGLCPLERVVLQLPNTPEFVQTFLALVSIGVIPVLALPAFRRTEIRHIVGAAEAVAYICPSTLGSFDFRPLGAEVQAEFGHVKFVFVAGEPGGGQIPLDPSSAAPGAPPTPGTLPPRLRPKPDEVALMLLSGGTTGLPKLIPRTHNDYVYNCKQSGRLAGFDARTVFLAALPLSHNYCLGAPGIMGVLAHGGTVVISPGTDAETVFPLVEQERVTFIASAVPLISKWLSSPLPDRTDLKSLRVVMNGGARLAPELRKRVEDRFACTFMESYGTSEGLLNQTRMDDSEEIRFLSSGKPVSPGDEVKILDEQGREVPDGEAGELVCRGPYTVRGYYNAPEANGKSFTRAGFYRMGDSVRKVNGYLYVEGRKKDLINRGGEKISCEEVENYILANEKVQSACLVAMPDDVFGEKGCVFVIPKPGATITLAELTEFLMAQKIAKFKLPERLEVVAEFPISPAGKILRRLLRERIVEALAADTAGVEKQRKDAAVG